MAVLSRFPTTILQPHDHNHKGRNFKLILIEDTSSQVFRRSNADAFGSHANHYGKMLEQNRLRFRFAVLQSSTVWKTRRSTKNSSVRKILLKSTATILYFEIWVNSLSTNSLKSNSRNLLAHTPTSDNWCPVSQLRYLEEIARQW